MQPRKACRYCKQTNPLHWPYQCKQNPKTKKYITKLGKYGKKNMAFRNEWLQKTASKDGWVCYLQITPQCPIKLTAETVTLEHVEPKSGAPQLRYEFSNIKPACYWCNAKKGSKRLENMV